MSGGALSAPSFPNSTTAVSPASQISGGITYMYTDNISIYASFFGNLHFLMLGLGYAALRTANENDPTPEPPAHEEFVSRGDWRRARVRDSVPRL